MSYENKTVTVQRSCGRGARERLESCLPAVFSVDMAAYECRFPKRKKQEWADAQPIHQVIVPFDEQNKVNGVTFSVFPPCPRTKRTPGPDSELRSLDRIKQLLTGSQVKKKGRLLGGSPETQVEGIIDFLKEHDFLDFMEKG
mgnify:CR=1 FL=1